MSKHLLPPNSTSLEKALADATHMQHTPELLATLSDAQRCPIALLPWLAWALSVDEWDPEWAESRQRAAVLAAVELHRKKGTPWAVLRALAVHGFPDCEIVEYAVFLHEWQASGGKYLDGSWKLSGIALAPNVVGARDVVRNAALNHWANYAIRVNTADMAWTREQQQKLATIAQRYAPARAHLVALIDIVRGSFTATPGIGQSRQKIRTRFAECTRISSTGLQHLDGCWLLDGTKQTPRLDGAWSLQGQQLAPKYTGQQLGGGNLLLRERLRLKFGVQASAGVRKYSPRRLGWGWRTLDGQWRLDAMKLGGWPLNGSQRMNTGQLDQLDSLPSRIDGSWSLGSLGENESSIWAHGRITVRSRGLITTEAL